MTLALTKITNFYLSILRAVNLIIAKAMEAQWNPRLSFLAWILRQQSPLCENHIHIKFRLSYVTTELNKMQKQLFQRPGSPEIWGKMSITTWINTLICHILMQVFSGYIGVSVGCEDHETLILVPWFKTCTKKLWSSHWFLMASFTTALPCTFLNGMQLTNLFFFLNYGKVSLFLSLFCLEELNWLLVHLNWRSTAQTLFVRNAKGAT